MLSTIYVADESGIRQFNCSCSNMEGALMKHSYRILLVLPALLFLSVGVASADSMLSYSFSGPVSASFELPVTPTVIISAPGFGFEVTPTNLIINGAASSDFLTFYSSAFGGGFGACFQGSCLDLLLKGAQLYSGPEATPTMIALGGEPLIDRRTGNPAGTISTPEPSGLMLLAFGLIMVLALVVISRGSKRRLSIVAS
jgi:hypothetical protein